MKCTDTSMPHLPNFFIPHTFITERAKVTRRELIMHVNQIGHVHLTFKDLLLYLMTDRQVVGSVYRDI